MRSPTILPNIVVIGLGYVGLPLAVALARKFPTTGVDVDADRIAELGAGIDRTREVEPSTLMTSSLRFSSDLERCRGADIYIITVPTPVDDRHVPDLGAVLSAARAVGRVIDATRRPIIVFESTVYPGVTEDLCGPEIENASGLTCGTDFFLGYSPERINPGDKVHTVDKITKVVAGQNADVANRLAEVYGAITSGGTFIAASIKTAEAAKVIENTQRDVNIALMNEIARIFSRLDVSIWDVLETASTKWNFLPFQPGLVGGHCIGVDPYYLSYRAQQLGCDPQVILAGRGVNDGMAEWLAEEIDKKLAPQSEILCLGLTFKENVPDLRNSKVADLITALTSKGHHVTVFDPMADADQARHEYGVVLNQDPAGPFAAIIAAVAHDAIKSLAAPNWLRERLDGERWVFDIKRLWRRPQIAELGMRYWSL